VVKCSRSEVSTDAPCARAVAADARREAIARAGGLDRAIPTEEVDPGGELALPCLLERVLEERRVGQHAMQVAPDGIEGRPEVAEGEAAAERLDVRRVLFEEARQHRRRHALEPPQVDDDALLRAADRAADPGDERARGVRVERALEPDDERRERLVGPGPQPEPRVP